MTDATIFEAGTDNTSAPAAETTNDAALFSALVGEKQKYKSPEDLAKAYVNADKFINELKEENRSLREQAASAKTIDEVIEQISSANKVPQGDNLDVQAITPDVVQNLVEETLKKRESVSVRNANLQKADSLMKTKFGEKAEQVFKQRATTPEKAQVLMQLAATDPEEFFNLFAGVQTPSNTMDSSSVNTTTYVASSGDRAKIEGTKEWAKEVRDKSPSIYWSAEFQSKLQNLAIKNPSLYFGN